MQEIGRDVDTSLPLDDDQNSILMDTGLLSNFSTSLYPVEESNDVLNEENSGNGSLSTGVEWIMDGGKQHIIERNADEPIGSEAGFHVGASDACDYFEDYPNQYAEDSNNYGLSDIYARFAPIPED